MFIAGIYIISVSKVFIAGIYIISVSETVKILSFICRWWERETLTLKVFTKTQAVTEGNSFEVQQAPTLLLH